MPETTGLVDLLSQQASLVFRYSFGRALAHEQDTERLEPSCTGAELNFDLDIDVFNRANLTFSEDCTSYSRAQICQPVRPSVSEIACTAADPAQTKLGKKSFERLDRKGLERSRSPTEPQQAKVRSQKSRASGVPLRNTLSPVNMARSSSIHLATIIEVHERWDGERQGPPKTSRHGRLHGLGR